MISEHLQHRRDHMFSHELTTLCSEVNVIGTLQRARLIVCAAILVHSLIQVIHHKMTGGSCRKNCLRLGIVGFHLGVWAAKGCGNIGAWSRGGPNDRLGLDRKSFEKFHQIFPVSWDVHVLFAFARTRIDQVVQPAVARAQDNNKCCYKFVIEVKIDNALTLMRVLAERHNAHVTGLNKVHAVDGI